MADNLFETIDRVFPLQKMMFLNAVYLIACVSPATMTSTSMTANLSGFASMSINHTGHAEVSFFGQV